MKPKFMLLNLCMFVSYAYGQVKFERGYFINNENHRTDCFIKNYDRETTPYEFEYKLNENDVSSKGYIYSVSEFGITNESKFVRADVKIDRSSNEITNLSTQRNPIWSEEQLFLKVLIEGKATLYQYKESNFDRFFYSVSGSPVQQLIYKEYLFKKEGVAYNFDFRQQLWNNLRLEGKTESSVENIIYYQKELESYFTLYNNQYLNTDGDSNNILRIPTDLKSLFFLRLTPGVSFSSFTLESTDQFYLNKYSDKCVSFRAGVESGFVLPFNRNKLALLIEPTFAYFKSENTNMKMDYSAIEFPIGVRYFFFLSDNIKVFVNTFYVPGFKVYFNKSLKLNSNLGLGNTFRQYDLPNRNCIAFGGGIDYKKASLEFRYYTKSSVFDQYSDWTSATFILGYKLF